MAIEQERCGICGLVHAMLAVEIRGRVLYRRATGSRHLLKKYNGGWSFDCRLIERHLPELDTIEVCDVESGRLYTTSAATFRENGMRLTIGGSAQIALPLRYWSVSGSASKAVQIEHAEKPKQQPLFVMRGGV